MQRYMTYYYIFELLSAACVKGWSLRHFRSSSRSAYLRLVHPLGRRLVVRVSDHKSKHYNPDNKKRFSINTRHGRSVSAFPYVIKALNSV